MHGIRRAAKGEVADSIRRLGTRVTVDQVLNKLESVYGNIETCETVMKKMYNCTQKPNESVTGFASRLEEYFDRAVLLGGINKDTEILKGVLYQGLRKDIKHVATYKYETITEYDKFKIELQKIEAEMKEEHDTEKDHVSLQFLQRNL